MEKKQLLHPRRDGKVGGEGSRGSLWGWLSPESQEVPRGSSVGTEDAMEPIRHWHPDFCSPQLLEGLCIQDEQESTLVLQEEQRGRVSVQAELLALFAHKGTEQTTETKPAGQEL